VLLSLGGDSLSWLGKTPLLVQEGCPKGGVVALDIENTPKPHAACDPTVRNATLRFASGFAVSRYIPVRPQRSPVLRPELAPGAPGALNLRGYGGDEEFYRSEGAQHEQL